MELISVGQHAQGVVAIGQHATGIVAIGQEATGFVAVGQVATGVFALGQLARGGVVVGQLAVGLFSVGMLSVGVFRTAAMMGLAARGVPEWYSLMPTTRPHTGLPPLKPARERVARGEPGWSRLRIVRLSPGELHLEADGRKLEGVRLAADLRKAANRRAKGEPVELIGHLAERDGTWVIVSLKAPSSQDPGLARWTLWLGVRFAVLCVVAFVVLVVGILPLWQAAGSPMLMLPAP